MAPFIPGVLKNILPRRGGTFRTHRRTRHLPARTPLPGRPPGIRSHPGYAAADASLYQRAGNAHASQGLNLFAMCQAHRDRVLGSRTARESRGLADRSLAVGRRRRHFCQPAPDEALMTKASGSFPGQDRRNQLMPLLAAQLPIRANRAPAMRCATGVCPMCDWPSSLCIGQACAVLGRFQRADSTASQGAGMKRPLAGSARSVQRQVRLAGASFGHSGSENATKPARRLSVAFRSHPQTRKTH